MRAIHIRGSVLVVLASLLAGSPPARAADSTWVDHARAAQAAHAAGDVAGYRGELLRVRAAIGETPGVTYGLARAAARLGGRAEALAGLETYARAGLVRDLAADSDLVSLRGDPRYQRVAERLAANGRPLGQAVTAHAFEDAALLPEDLAFDADARCTFVSSIHRALVLRVDGRGVEREFAQAPAGRRWGLFALGIDGPRRWLWASAAATATCAEWDTADAGRSGLFAWDLRTGVLVRTLEVARDGRPHVLGDLCVAPDGAVVVSDSRSGEILRLAVGADSLATLVPRGTFGSPQGVTMAADRRSVFVADYPRGIARVELATGRVRWLGFPPGVALQGIDGLYRVGHDLVAIQNGVQPHRVMRFHLDGSGTRVTGGEPLLSALPELGEPSHAAIVGDALVVLARTGWDRVGADELLPERADDPPPLLLRVPLRAGAKNAVSTRSSAH